MAYVPLGDHEKESPSSPAPLPSQAFSEPRENCSFPFLRRVCKVPKRIGIQLGITHLVLKVRAEGPPQEEVAKVLEGHELALCWRGLVGCSTRLDSGRQWGVDESLVLVSHDLTRGVGGLHVAKPPELTFGGWRGKRGSHEVSCPLSARAPCHPTPGTALWALTLSLPPTFSFWSFPSLSLCSAMRESVCICV